MKRLPWAAVPAAFTALILGVGTGLCEPALRWTKVFDSNPGQDGLARVVAHPGGGIVALSENQGAGIRTLRFGTDGSLWWDVFQAGADWPVGPAVAVGTGDIYSVGRNFSTGFLYVAKYLPTGVKVWDNTFDLGGNATPMCAKADGSGDLFVAGNLDDGVNPKGIFTVKIAKSTGAKVWQAVYHGADSSDSSPAFTEIFARNYSDNPESLALTSSGNVVVAGYMTDSILEDEVVVLEYSGATGDNVAIPARFGGAGQQKAYAVAVAPDNEIYVSGRVNTAGVYDFLLLRYGPDLTLRGTARKGFGLGTVARFVLPGGADNVFIAGGSSIVAYRVADPDTDPVEQWTFTDNKAGTVKALGQWGNGFLVALVDRPADNSVSVTTLRPDGSIDWEVAYTSSAQPGGITLSVADTATVYAGGAQFNGTDQDIFVARVGESVPPSGNGSGGGGGCFIATAAWGSGLAPEVDTLRVFRDRWLLVSPIGRFLVKAYYRISPPLAGWIAPRNYARKIARFFVVPVVMVAATALRGEIAVSFLCILFIPAFLVLKPIYSRRLEPSYPRKP